MGDTKSGLGGIPKNTKDLHQSLSRSFSKPRAKRARVRPTYRGRLGRFWFRHPRSKQAAYVGGGLVLLVVGVLAIRLWLTASKIFDDGSRAVALGENIDPSLLNREGDSRINVLLIGVGGENHTGGDLSDSIMIASLDPVTKDMAIVSLPRDLYMEIPGFGSAKINAAHAYGEQYDYPGGGVKLLSDTITENLNIPIHYYMRIDFAGFRKAVDAVGGVDVYVEQDISDLAYPNSSLSGYEPFYLKAGHRHLSGEVALKYARSRYTTSDFDRAERQQQLMVAFKDKVLNLGLVFDPVKFNKLLSIAGEHARTNLAVEDGLKILDIVKQIPSETYKRSNLDSTEGNLLVSQVVDGAWVLVPASGDFSEIKRYFRKLMPDGFIKKEAVKVKVLNGTDRPGLAQSVARLLRSFGYTVVEVGNYAGAAQEKTVLLDHNQGSNIYTLNYLKKRFRTEPQVSADSDSLAGVTVIIGQDYHLTDD